ncbi:helix-hairpin-helix domain-containing protein [Oribacterium sinus]
MPKLCLSSLKRGKIVLLLLMLMLLGFLFLMNRERERRIIYQGAAGEEKEAFLARGAYESLEAKRKVKLPEKQSKTAEEKQEGRENQKIEDSVEVESQENLEGSKKAKKEENPEISKEDSEAESKAEIGKDGEKKDAGIANSREEIQQNRKEEKININTATEQELESLKGIGPATAKNIIRYREEYGGFSSIEEIKNVKRIGDKIFEKIKADICV